jgi:hypothetical protein
MSAPSILLDMIIKTAKPNTIIPGASQVAVNALPGSASGSGDNGNKCQ